MMLKLKRMSFSQPAVGNSCCCRCTVDEKLVEVGSNVATIGMGRQLDSIMSRKSSNAAQNFPAEIMAIHQTMTRS